MGRGMAAAALCLLLLALGSARGDLTGQLVEDSDQMANIVGARETMSLVDYSLKKEQATRDRVAEDTESVKARAKETYLKLEQTEKEQADAVALKRHLQEQLEIISAEDQEKKEVALKAEAIAHRMEEMVAKADGAWHEVQQAKKTAAAGFEEAKTTVKATSAAEAKAQKEEQEAEDSAQLASSKLAIADQEVQRLLKKHQKLEDLQMAEDEKQTTRLADAFKQDAVRQKAFKQAMLAATAAEKRQQMLSISRGQEKKTEAEARVSGFKRSLANKKVASITQLRTLEHALLRANPELESLRPKGDSKDSDGSSVWRGQQTPEGSDDGGMVSQDADKARWEELSQVVGHAARRESASSETDDEFTVPASNSPRM